MGFGIPVLVEDVHNLMATGASMDDAIKQVAAYCELRSEAIEALRKALLPPVGKDGERS